MFLCAEHSGSPEMLRELARGELCPDLTGRQMRALGTGLTLRMC